MTSNNVCLVVLSGGQDSTTCLGIAKSCFDSVYAIAFDYGQKHVVELEQAVLIADKCNVPLAIHDIPSLGILGDSALTTEGDVGVPHHRNSNLPASFVPNRNALFLTIAHAAAQKIGAGKIMTGVCQTDYSGYPDCREVFIKSLMHTLNLGYETNIEILTPLMHMTKAETFKMAESVGILETVIELSHTCYNGERGIVHEWGHGCGHCPACEIRAKGYEEFIGMTR